MSGRVYLDSPPIDWEDEQDEVAVSASADLTAAMTEIVAFRAKMGKKFKITGFGQAWDAGMNTFLVYSLLIDGVPHPKYNRKKVQITPPEQVGYSPIPTPIEVPQGARISVAVVSTVAGNFAARVKGEYSDYERSLAQ